MRFKHISRGRMLTESEAAKYAAMREEASAEASRGTPHPDELPDRLIDFLAIRQFIGQLRSERERQGKTLSDLAAKTKIDSTALSRLENFRNDNPTYSTLARYARALGKELQLTLVDEDDNPAAAAPRRKRKTKAKPALRGSRRSAKTHG